MIESIFKYLAENPGGGYVIFFLIGGGVVWRFVVVALKLEIIQLRLVAETALNNYNNRILEDADFWKDIANKQLNS